jgi:hypothetical protein
MNSSLVECRTVHFEDGHAVAVIVEMVPMPPDWEAFRAAMLGSTLANAALSQAQLVESVSIAAATITSEIVNVSRGADVSPLREAWSHLLSNGLISAELLQAILQTAQQANLPDYVIEALQPPTP